MSGINQTFLIYGIVILLGYLVKRFGVVKEKEGKCLINLVYYLTLPAVILTVFNGQHFTRQMAIIFTVSIIYGILMTFVSLFFYRKRAVADQKGLFISSILGFNIPLFSYPFVMAIWGFEGLRYLAIFDMGSTPFFVFGVAYVTSAYFSPGNNEVKLKNIFKKLAVFIPLHGYLLALILMFLQIKLPAFIITVLNPLTKANTPLVLIILGLYLNFTGIRQYAKGIGSILSLRYISGIVVGAIVFLFIPFDNLTKTMVILALINPVGLAMIAYSVYFNYDSKFAGTLINVSNVISFIFIWGITILSINYHIL